MFQMLGFVVVEKKHDKTKNQLVVLVCICYHMATAFFYSKKEALE